MPAPADALNPCGPFPPSVELRRPAAGGGFVAAPPEGSAPSSTVKQPSRRLSSCAAAPIIAALALPSERIAAPEVPGKGALPKAVWKASASVRRASMNCGKQTEPQGLSVFAGDCCAVRP